MCSFAQFLFLREEFPLLLAKQTKLVKSVSRVIMRLHTKVPSALKTGVKSYS